jgi:outer membrane protein assembly factor BamB
MDWRTLLNDGAQFATRPEECATAAVLPDRVVVGTRAGRVSALRRRDGTVLWTTPVSGAVDAQASFDARLGQVYVGTDDGTFYALDPATGAIRWQFKARGAVERAPAIDGDMLFVATNADRVIALDARTGESRWQYDREPPEGFTIHGYAGPRVHKDVVVAGFSDGFLVVLRKEDGEPVWARSLASAAEQYVDVDSTPLVLNGEIVASSYSGGLYALSLEGGEQRWRLAVEGAGTVSLIDGRLYYAAPRDGLTALTTDGQILWRQGLAEAGDLNLPQAAGPYLLFTGSRAGLFVVDRATGRLLQVFNPGRGMCGAPALGPDGRTAYVLSNSGSLYALSVDF